MALEKIFKRPRKLAKLRSGALGNLQEGFCRWLQSQGFTRETIGSHLTNVSHLNEFLNGSTVQPRSMLTGMEIEEFFKAYPSWSRNRELSENHLDRVRYSINKFTAYLSDKGLFDPQDQPPKYKPLLDAYLEWMCHYQLVTAGTCEGRAHSITRFLEWLGPLATVQGMEKLNSEMIEAFFLSFAQTASRSVRHSMQSALRTFLRFCLHQGYILQPLDMAVPTLRTYKLSTVPRGLTEEQMQQVLQSVDRCTDVGIRNYAILQLLYTYGVRGGQVRALRLEDINWAENQILFRALKNGKESLLPLHPDVGRSLLEYLQKSRPCLNFPQVFLTCRAPYHHLAQSSSLTAIVKSRIQAAGIDAPSKGSHAFRHGFATRMLRQGHTLKSVADVLGHRHLSTTFIYTKVDFNALKQVALDWPEEVQG